VAKINNLKRERERERERAAEREGAERARRDLSCQQRGRGRECGPDEKRKGACERRGAETGE